MELQNRRKIRGVILLLALGMFAGAVVRTRYPAPQKLRPVCLIVSDAALAVEDRRAGMMALPLALTGEFSSEAPLTGQRARLPVLRVNLDE